MFLLIALYNSTINGSVLVNALPFYLSDYTDLHCCVSLRLCVCAGLVFMFRPV